MKERERERGKGEFEPSVYEKIDQMCGRRREREREREMMGYRGVVRVVQGVVGGSRSIESFDTGVYTRMLSSQAKKKPSGVQRGVKRAKNTANAAASATRFDATMTMCLRLLKGEAAKADAAGVQLSRDELLEGEKLAKEYSKQWLRRRRALERDLIMKVRLRDEAVSALPEQIRHAAMEPDYTPYPKKRTMPVEFQAQEEGAILRHSLFSLSLCVCVCVCVQNFMLFFLMMMMN